MKKNYNAPKAEMVKFDYNSQVVASGSTACGTIYGWRSGEEVDTCSEQHYKENVT